MHYIWMVGQFKEKCEHGIIWEMQGVFYEKSEAVAACRTDQYFVMRLVMGEQLPDGTVLPMHLWYPHSETEEEGIARV